MTPNGKAFAYLHVASASQHWNAGDTDNSRKVNLVSPARDHHDLLLNSKVQDVYCAPAKTHVLERSSSVGYTLAGGRGIVCKDDGSAKTLQACVQAAPQVTPQRIRRYASVENAETSQTPI